MTFFQVSDLTKRFRGLTAVDGLDFSVQKGEIVGLIGPNGAGKSTCFNVIARALPSTAGRIVFEDEDITRIPRHRVAARGLVRTFQQTSLFTDLDVRENIRCGCYLRSSSSVFDALFRSRRYHEDSREIDRATTEILELTGLSSEASMPAATLSFGNARKLGIAIALAARPRLLLMDEPAAGLNPAESQDFVRLTRAIRDSGVTILLVEHDMKVVMDLCERIVVIAAGRKLAEGKPHEIRENPDVIRTYLGTRLSRLKKASADA